MHNTSVFCDQRTIFLDSTRRVEEPTGHSGLMLHNPEAIARRALLAVCVIALSMYCVLADFGGVINKDDPGEIVTMA